MSFKLYPVNKVDYSVQNYDVKINGTSVILDTARVSAFPFNRRWPGHQRQIEQTELVNFLSLSTDQPLDFEITPKTPFENVEIRPKNLGITPVIQNGTIKFTLPKAAYFTVEPYGRHNALHIFADTMPDYNIDINDSNVIYFGKGFHDAGVINLKSNQTLFIDEGAVVFACVRAIDAENIKILGRGILDNSKNKEVILFEQNVENNNAAINNATREHTVMLEYCKNILIDGITIRDSLVYNIRPVGCQGFTVKNVKLIGNWRYNSDGIDMHNCVDVLIEHCFIRTFDDCICVKGFDCYYEDNVEAAVKKAMYRNGKCYDVFKNVLVRDCTLWNDWGKCLEIGAETRAEEICNIVFENCNIIHIEGHTLDCDNVDYADVHDVIYRNINIEFDDVIPETLIQTCDEETYQSREKDQNFVAGTIVMVAEFHHEYSAGGTRRGKNHDFLFENIHVYGRQPIKLAFLGYDSDHKVSNVTIRNIYKNGELLKEIPSEDIYVNEFAENIKIETAED